MSPVVLFTLLKGHLLRLGDSLRYSTFFSVFSTHPRNHLLTQATFDLLVHLTFRVLRLDIRAYKVLLRIFLWRRTSWESFQVKESPYLC